MGVCISMTQQSPFEDIDPTETQEWLESIDSVMRAQGPERAHFLLEKLVDFTRRSGAYLPFKPNTAYLNTISKAQEPDYPGDRSLERRNEAYIRWNALAMVVQANRASSEYGGHIATLRVGGDAVRSRLQSLLARAAAPRIRAT